MDEVMDGFTGVALGMNSLKDPFLLPEQQCAQAINVTFRGGLARTRPAFVQDAVNLPEGTAFQGAGVWHLAKGDVIVFVQDGVVYTLRLTNLKLVRYGKRFMSGTRCCFSQIEQYFIIMDGEQLPVVLEERDDVIKRRPVSSAEVSDATPEVLYQSLPRAGLGVFAHGRLHLVPATIPSTEESGKSSIVSGDIMEPFYPHKVLRFSETEYLSEGGAHSLPFSMGNVGALGVMRNAATGTGLGQVLVFAEDGVCGFDFSIPRAQWKEQALSQVLFFSCGSVSPWSIINLNDDVLYRAQDGVRSIRYTSAQAANGSGSLANVPMSNEIDSFIRDDVSFLPRVSSALWNNRVLMTCGGVLDTLDTSFRGITVWDTAAGYYNGISGIGAYDGLWTGLNVAQVLTARQRGVGKSVTYVLTSDMALFHADSDVVYDTTSVQESPIVSRLETKVFSLGDLGTTKQLLWVELWVKGVAVSTSIKLWYRSSGYPLWTALGDERTISVAAPTATGYPHLRRRLRFVVEVSDCSCDTPTGVPLWVGTGFQLAIQWTGNLTIERCQLAARPLSEAPPPPCDEDAASIEETECAGELLEVYEYAPDFEFVYSTGVEGGLWDLSGDDADPADPEDTDPVDPDDEPGFPDVPAIEDPPALPVDDAGGGDDGDDSDGAASGPGTGTPYQPPEDTEEEEEAEEGDPPTVRTRYASGQTKDAAMIRGSILGMSETFSAATGYLKYQKVGASSWTTTASTSISSTSSVETIFSASLTGLDADSQYRYQAWAVVPGVAAELYGSILTFQTLADPAVVEFAVISVSADNIGATSVRLKGALTAFYTEGVYADLDLSFHYKLVSYTGAFTATTSQQVTALGGFNQVITGLQPESEYLWYVQGLYAGKVVWGASRSFTTLSLEEALPNVVTGVAVPGLAGVYTLFASVTSLGSLTLVTPFFQYRIVDSGDDGWVYVPLADSDISTAPEEFSADTAALTITEEYEYRAGITYTDPTEVERTIYGDTLPVIMAVVETGTAALGVDKTTAELTGQVTEMGSIDTGTMFFQYRIIADPANEWTVQDVSIIWKLVDPFVPQLFFATLADLDPTEAYEYQAGLRFKYGAAEGLTTLGEVLPIPLGFAVLTVGATSAPGQMTVTGNITALGDYVTLYRFVEYRPEAPVEGPPEAWTRVAVAGTQTAVGQFVHKVTGLTEGATYDYRVGCYTLADGDVGFGDVLSIRIAYTQCTVSFNNYVCWWSRTLYVINNSLAEG